MKKITSKGLLLGIVTLLGMNLTNANDLSQVKVSVTPVNGDVYMLQGAGGNIGVLATDQGLVMIDDQFQPLAEKIEAAMMSIKPQPLKYIINTHYHGDHTGSNSYFSHKAPIFAHHNVRNRLSQDDKITADALPVVTYDNGLTIHIGNETVQLTHLAKGHTDGDTVVYFKQANVLHTGDLFFEGRFPYVDLKGGGTVNGYLANVNQLIKQYPDDVKIIPGHGKLATKADYQSTADMIAYSIEHVNKLLAAGKSEQEILAAGIGEQYKSWSWEFITEEKWLKTLIADSRKL